MMAELAFKPPEARDFDILRSIRTHLYLNHQTEFSADDLRGLGLDRFFKNTQNGVGGWFATMQHFKFIDPVGWKRSTQENRHMAVNRTYRLTGKDLH